MRELMGGNITDHKKRFWLCWVVTAIVVGGLVLEYAILNELITDNGDNQAIWGTNYDLQGCGTKLYAPIQTYGIVGMGIVGYGPGTYFGLLT
jgi:hypothetical protein